MRDDEVVYTYTKSPSGAILVARNEAGLTRIDFQDGPRPFLPKPEWRQDEEALVEAVDQLRAYFYGELTTFDLPLAPDGTPFQRQVWKALESIPCGATVSYGQVASRIGRPTATRAVGAANGKNPLPIVIPCHRVIGSDGRLTGYAGGLKIKKALLEHEQKMVPRRAGDNAIVYQTELELAL